METVNAVADLAGVAAVEPAAGDADREAAIDWPG